MIASERGRSPGAVSVRSMISLHQPEAMSMKEEKDHMQVSRLFDSYVWRTPLHCVAGSFCNSSFYPLFFFLSFYPGTNLYIT